jgi:hypothetical protein
MEPFERFRQAFKPTGPAAQPETSFRNRDLIAQVPGLSQLISDLAGRVLNGGIYRFLDDALAEAADEFVAEAFPVWRDLVAPFGCDWMGRIYAVDGSRRRSADSGLCPFLLDPATRDLLKVPASVVDFHDTILITDAEIAVEEQLWRAWRSKAKKDLGYTQIAGWKKPGFLGGSLELKNLEVQLARVYWPLSGQLIAQAFKLKLGTRIKSVTIE